MNPTAITFNGFNLNDTSYITSDIRHLSAPSRSIEMFNLARTPGAVITDTNFTTKNIAVSGTVVGTGIVDFEIKLDALQGALTAVNANLDISYASGTRRYKCTVAKVNIEKPATGASFALYDIEFTATEYGMDIADTIALNAVNFQVTPKVNTFTITGSAPQQYLDFTATFTAIDVSNNGIARSFTLTNPATGEAITINRVWANNDVLTIRSSDKFVAVNNLVVDWTGAYLTYGPGAATLTTSHTFTAGVTALPSIIGNFSYRRRFI